MAITPSKQALTGGKVVMRAGWEQVLNQQMESSFGAAADTMEAEARSNVAVDTGELKSSIGSYVSIAGLNLIAVCEATAAHADFVEYGTGQRGKSSSQRGAGRVPVAAGYNHGASAGMRAQPFLRPAMVTATKRHFKFGSTR